MVFFVKKFKKDPKTLFNSFKYAFSGIKYSFFAEANMQIHVTIMTLVIIFGFVFNISLFEWIACILLFGGVISLELVNTAIEVTIDMMTKEIDPMAKIAKDTAAGAVLVMAIVAFVIGLIIFVPKITLALGW